MPGGKAPSNQHPALAAGNAAVYLSSMEQRHGQGTHNLGLDLARSTAILLVLFSHTAPWWLGEGEQTNIEAAYYGGAGVDLFFSLSGFLIGGILLRAQPSSPRALGQFWARRWLRTIPPYWVVLFLLSVHFDTGRWRDYVFLQSFVPMTQWTPLLPQSWSLVLEEWFYLVAPLLLAGLAAALGPARRSCAVPLGCALLIVGGVMGRAWAHAHQAVFFGPTPGLNPLLRPDCAAWGLAGAWFVRRRPLTGGMAWTLLAAGLILLAALQVVWSCRFSVECWAAGGYPVRGLAWPPLQPTLTEFATGLVVLGLHRLLPGGAGPIQACVTFLASLSYALYLVHVPVLFLLGAEGPIEWHARLWAVFLIMAAALALRYGVERPVLALRDRLMPVRPAGFTAAAAMAGASGLGLKREGSL